ncbi:hypothetical protein SD77_2854 [Bacillus badius]|uniref:MBL fold metallo-hydrolase n=1 Tax=Bacillus badius TaxID=1455 RepID=A0ABR5APD5_BACBA|nr:hypothetical protein SD77_2854 [Bacillus badius]
MKEELGTGFALEKMFWSCGYHILLDEKKIIVVDPGNSEE